MKLLNMLTTNLSSVMNVVAIMSGISSLIFSGITWTNTEVVKKDIKRHHNDLVSIPDLKIYRNESKNFLKRLDKDVDILFNDLGKANDRTRVSTEMILKSIGKNRNRTKNEIKNTNEKIKSNSEMIEMYYKNLDSRIIAIRSIVDRNKRRFEYML